MYQTPAAHRIITKKSVRMSDGSEKLVTEVDKHIVIVRPKAYVPSSGSTWASETHRLRCEYPDVHEIPPIDQSSQYSCHFRQFCARLHGDVFLLCDVTMQEDLEKMTNSDKCIHRDYELKRLTHFINRKNISCEIVDLNKTKMGTAENEQVEKIKSSLIPLMNHCNKLKEQLESGKRPEIEEYDNLKAQSHEVLDILKSLGLPEVKPCWAEFTDAGPGVGVSNLEVKFRSSELDRIYSRDYRIRLHRSRGGFRAERS